MGAWDGAPPGAWLAAGRQGRPCSTAQRIACAGAPGGGHAYVLAGQDAGSGGATLLQLDLVTGATNRIVELPAAGVELAVAERYIYVTNPGAGGIWVIDPRERRIARTLTLGQRPLALAATWP